MEEEEAGGGAEAEVEGCGKDGVVLKGEGDREAPALCLAARNA